MKTIAIDEATAKLLDALAETSSRRRSRAALVRTALRQYAERVRRQAREAKDGAVFRKDRKRLARQASALIKEQARLRSEGKSTAPASGFPSAGRSPVFTS